MEPMESNQNTENVNPETSNVEAGEPNPNQDVNDNAVEANKAEGEGEGDQVVTRDDGTQWIPKQRLDQVLAKLDEAKDPSKFLEALKSDPEKKAEFMQILNDLEKDNQEPGPAPFEKWVNEAVPQEAREHYMGFAKAFAGEMQSWVQSQLAPLISAVGEFKLQQVSTKLPDFSKHQAEIAKVMNQYPGIPPEMAYTWVTRNKTFKQGKDAALKEAQTKNKNNAPINNKRQNAMPGNSNQAKTFAERLAERLGE